MRANTSFYNECALSIAIHAYETLKRWRVFLATPRGLQSTQCWGTGSCILSISGWRLRKKAADALHVISVLITEALDQVSFLGPRTHSQ
jgi:hypothetical protein